MALTVAARGSAPGACRPTRVGCPAPRDDTPAFLREDQSAASSRRERAGERDRQLAHRGPGFVLACLLALVALASARPRVSWLTAGASPRSPSCRMRLWASASSARFQRDMIG